MCIFQRRQFSAVFFVSVPCRSRTFSPATHTMKPKEHNANGGENMEGLLWLLILCTLTAGALAILGICRRIQEHTLPERIVTWVALSEQAQLQAQLEALAAQVLWADCALLKTVWLVDATPEKRLLPDLQAFCRTHRGFRCCHMEELPQILEEIAPAQK